MEIKTTSQFRDAIRFVWVTSALCGAFMSACLFATAAPEPEQKKWLNEFPAYPGALIWATGCSRSHHVVGGCRTITWESYTTPDAPEAVHAFYKKNYSAADKDGSYRLMVGGQPSKVLSIATLSSKNYPETTRPVRANAKTVISVSVSSP